MAPVVFLVTRVESIISELSGYMKEVGGFYHYKGTTNVDISSRNCHPSLNHHPILMPDVKHMSYLSQCLGMQILDFEENLLVYI